MGFRFVIFYVLSICGGFFLFAEPVFQGTLYSLLFCFVFLHCFKPFCLWIVLGNVRLLAHKIEALPSVNGDKIGTFGNHTGALREHLMELSSHP